MTAKLDKTGMNMSENMTQLLAKLAAVTVERDALAAELAKLREQEPVTFVFDPNGYAIDGKHTEIADALPIGMDLYAAPIPALAVLAPDDIHDLAYELGGTDSGEYHLEPEALDSIVAAVQAMAAVPDWNVNIERIRDVMHMLGISIDESVECFSAALPTNINRMTLAMKRHLQKLAGMTAITPTPFIPDDDTRRNDEAFAAQQAAPSVPEEWREVMAELAADLQAACDAEHPHRDQYPSVMRKYQNDMRIVERARALLQSANHSERNLEMVAPDCLTCANLGRVNGLSQESYCDSCVYQGRDWRQNHFVDARKMVDAVKRRCEACSILPCSCK